MTEAGAVDACLDLALCDRKPLQVRWEGSPGVGGWGKGGRQRRSCHLEVGVQWGEGRGRGVAGEGGEAVGGASGKGVWQMLTGPGGTGVRREE